MSSRQAPHINPSVPRLPGFANSLALACAACFLKALELPRASSLYTSHSPHLTFSWALFFTPSRLWHLRRYILGILLTIPQAFCPLKGALTDPDSVFIDTVKTCT
ncbi:hypothetical protein B0H13DRAFT_2661328 [Mycena leptocephala]|nr:hypothetical protein B0H13DRAFT_2661328 [Mycena leptocephala]